MHPPADFDTAAMAPDGRRAKLIAEGALQQTGKRRVRHVMGWVILLLAGTALGFNIDDALLAWVQNRHGQAARQRVQNWRDLLATSPSLAEMQKLEAVNTFFNRLNFTPDRQTWQREDYWATPLETLALGAGDCEDFALAKYFTLTALGVEESRLRLTYVKALKLNQAHMVLTYYAEPDAAPWVLDNLDPRIKPATDRDDLVPVYSFNGMGLWLARQRGQGKPAGGSERLPLWRDMLERMRQESNRTDLERSP